MSNAKAESPFSLPAHAPAAEGYVTPGGLPSRPFEHPGPTAVGVLDLDLSATPRAPDGQICGAGEPDALLLVRLHGEPLAVVHVSRDLRATAEGELLDLVWRSAGQRIRMHAQSFACMEAPSCASELMTHCGPRAPACRGVWPVSSDQRLAVIVCTAGRAPQLTRCIRSILAQARSQLELLVVDNRPELPETREAVASAAPGDARVRYVAEPRVGLSVARNRGVSETDAAIVAFTDDDVLADPGWLGWLADSFKDPQVLAACGMVLPLELQTTAQKRFEQYDGFCKGLEHRSYDRSLGREQRRILYPFINGMIGVGNSMAFRRAELVAAGGFDAALGAGSPARAGEETCAFSTALLRGGRIVYQPRAVCWHEHRREGDALRGQVRGYGTSVGAVITKAMLSDPRFYIAAAQSLPILIRDGARRIPASRERRDSTVTARARDLERARRVGMLQGPLLYAKGVWRARNLGLNEVIHGR